MRTEQALKCRDRAISAIRDLHQQAAHFGMSSSELNTRVAEIHANQLKKCPEWVHEYVRGYRAALIDSLYARELVFGGFVGDKFFSTHRNRADYYEKNGIEPNAYADDGLVKQRGHYWAQSITAGNPKPFFIS